MNSKLSNWTADIPSFLDRVWLSLFQINRGDSNPTEAPSGFPPTQLDSSVQNSGSGGTANSDFLTVVFETILIFLAFALFAGQLPPDVNESHYLTKAKHFWDAQWASGDLFLGSSFSHWLFYVSTGWLTKFMSLSMVAWVGRFMTWGLLAFAWQRLCWRLFNVRWLAIFAAILFAILNERFHLAGEWVVGGFEAKGLAYFFVLLALGNVVTKTWTWVWPLLGIATAFHVLVGGWSILAIEFSWLGTIWLEVNQEPNYLQLGFERIKKQVWPLLVGAALGLIGIIPPLMSDQMSSPEVASAAQLIYVNHRIAHHLTFDAFPTMHVARFTLVVVFWLVLHRWLKARWIVGYRNLYPLFLFGLGSLLISFFGLLLSGLAEQGDELSFRAATLLRFYWFRLSDFAIPATTAIGTSALVWYWMGINRSRGTLVSSWIFVACIVAAFGVMAFERHEDPRPRADRRSLPQYDNDESRTLATYRNWVKVCDWVRNNTPSNAAFITPNQQQTFKWYTGRREIVCWKDIPQDAEGILEWNERLNRLGRPQKQYEAGLLSYSDEQLRAIGKHYQADFLVIPQRCIDVAQTATTLTQVYPEKDDAKSTYVVLRLKD